MPPSHPSPRPACLSRSRVIIQSLNSSLARLFMRSRSMQISKHTSNVVSCQPTSPMTHTLHSCPCLLVTMPYPPNRACQLRLEAERRCRGEPTRGWCRPDRLQALRQRNALPSSSSKGIKSCVASRDGTCRRWWTWWWWCSFFGHREPTLTSSRLGGRGRSGRLHLYMHPHS